MLTQVSREAYARLGDFVMSRMGLVFPPERERDLIRGAQSAAAECGFDDVEAWIDWLVESTWTRQQIEMLAGHLTVGETYFFRNRNQYEFILEQILPALLQSRRNGDRRLRFWSAACCTGEEPYTLAMMMDRLVPDLDDWNVTILATDINPRFLEKAGEGIFTDWSFRETPDSFRENYFRETGNGRFRIVPRIRRMVNFAPLNLATDEYPTLAGGTNAMDVVFCRNVMIYFAQDLSERVVGKLHNCIVDGGWLAVSPSEAGMVPRRLFQGGGSDTALLFRKGPPAPRRIEPSPVRRLPQAFLPGKRLRETAPPPSEKTVAARMREARELHDGGRYEKAAGILTRILTEDMPLLTDGSAAHETAMSLLAQCRANLGELTEAQEWCEKAIAHNKLNAELHRIHAAVLQELGSFDRAAEALQRVLFLDPGFVPAHFSLGNICRQLGKAGEARRHWNNALRLLRDRNPDEILPDSGGLTAGRLVAIIEANNE
jgi:chemotaxis protein methyltransferase CheR